MARPVSDSLYFQPQSSMALTGLHPEELLMWTVTVFTVLRPVLMAWTLLCYVMLRYVMLRYVMLFFLILLYFLKFIYLF